MGRRSVLLIDVNARDVGLTQRAFKQAGLVHDLEVVYTVDAAFTDLLSDKGNHRTNRAPRLALVVLDTGQLPTDQCETVRRLKQDPHMKLIPVVVLATSSCVEEVRRVYEAGAAAYLVKPMESRRFVLMMEQIGVFWLELVELPLDG